MVVVLLDLPHQFMISRRYLSEKKKSLIIEMQVRRMAKNQGDYQV